MNKKIKIVIETTSEKTEVKLIIPSLNTKDDYKLIGTYETENGWTSVTELSDNESNIIFKDEAMNNLNYIINDTFYDMNELINSSKLHKLAETINGLITHISDGCYSNEQLNDLYYSHEMLGAALDFAKDYKDKKDLLTLEFES